MAGYIFIPVPTPEMIEFAQSWAAGRNAKLANNANKQPYQVLCNDNGGKGYRRQNGLGVLRKLATADKLYILAHGHSLGSVAIGAARGAKRRQQPSGKVEWVGGKLKKYSADELAKLLEDEGLGKTFIDLRVYACGSAIAPTPPGQHPGTTVAFADGLKNAMKARGYNSISVTGYEGALESGYSERHEKGASGQWTKEPHKGVEIKSEWFPAKSHSVVFR
jgi:hypothetical protein